MSYNFRVASFASGATTFDATAAGVYPQRGTAGGPDVVNRLVTNDAGMLIDLDGTGPAALNPPEIEHTFVFSAAHPAGHSQYNNLISLLGKSGTLTGRIPNATTYATKTVTARLIKLDGNWEGLHKSATPSTMIIRATWQLKELVS